MSIVCFKCVRVHNMCLKGAKFPISVVCFTLTSLSVCGISYANQ